MGQFVNTLASNGWLRRLDRKVFTLSASASNKLAHEHLLDIPVLVPATLAAYAVLGERQQGTLEPVLTTPIRRAEFLLGNALAALVLSVAIAYAVYAFFLACVELFARPAVVPALLRGPDILAQLLFTPLLAAWSIWVGITISARWNDIRVAQQFGMLASLPSIAVTTLIAYGVIHATLGLGAGLAPALLIIDRLGLAGRVSGIRPRRLITGRSPRCSCALGRGADDRDDIAPGATHSAQGSP